MKLVLPLIVVGVVLSIILFFAGLISPSHSRRWQATTSKWFRRAERKGDESAGRAGDLTRDAFRITRQATEASGQKGRDLHDELPPKLKEPGRDEERGSK
jgi:hypothetical protein